MPTLLIAAIKFSDLGHCLKPLPVHLAWTERVTQEFWALGDVEKVCPRRAHKAIV